MVERREFLKLAEHLQEFLLDSIEEFVTGAGLPFDRDMFLQETSADFPQLVVEALFYGSDAYTVSGSDAAAA